MAKKDKKKFGDTKLGAFLKNKAPSILGLVGDILPDQGALGVIKNLISKDSGIPDGDKLEFEKLARDYEQEELKMILADKDSARDLQKAALLQDDKFSKNYIYYLGSFIIVSAVMFGVMLFFVEVPAENKRLVEMFADIFLFAGALAVIQFFFGSSKSSHDKTHMLNK